MNKINILFCIFTLICQIENSIAQDNNYAILAVTESPLTPLIEARKLAIQTVLKQNLPVLLLNDKTLSTIQLEAQQIALGNAEFTKECRSEDKNEALLNEIFGILPARPSDFGNQQTQKECADGSCYRVEMYNYALNLASVALVQVNQKKVLRIGKFPHTQPDIPTSLKQLALHIATESPEVEKALGFKPNLEAAVMSDTKTALNRSRCERSKHLCVAPTFVKNDKALWAIVDLSELNLVGIRWTNVGAPQQMPTERRLQNEHLSECYCKKVNTIERDGWKMNYILTSSDGLRVSELDYHGKRVVNSAKLVDWHVNYSNTDGFGYSDAVGCPFFSAAAVVAIEAPKILDLVENQEVVGFTVEQNYYSEGWPTACNYNYKQRYEFYKDGRFRVAVASLGRGCGNNGTYRPVTRIAFAGKNKFAAWTGNDWKTWKQEQWSLQTATTPLAKENAQYKIQDSDNHGFVMLANVGQFNDGGRGDNAYVYVTKNKPDADEGESDLMTIGPCCNTDYRQGPEKFIEPQPDTIENEELVVWYVAQIKNDDTKGREYCWAESFIENGIFQTKTYPCFSGAMWVPLNDNALKQ
jgi:hypothetical protein